MVSVRLPLLLLWLPMPESARHGASADNPLSAFHWSRDSPDTVLPSDYSESARRKILFKKITISPFRYARYKKVVASLSQEEQLLGGEEVNKTPDAVKEAVLGILKHYAPSYVRHLDQALKYEKFVNRALVLEDEVLHKRYFTTLSMLTQSQVLSVLIGSLPPQPGLKVLFAGCGVGDWAAELALALDDASRVLCWNYGELSMNLGLRAFRHRKLHDVFDISSMNAKQKAAAKAVLSGSKLTFLCSEPHKSACDFQGSGGLLVTKVDKFARVFGNAAVPSLGLRHYWPNGRVYQRGSDEQGFNVIAYGNALIPTELAAVRTSLSKKNSFALVPVCLRMWPSSDEHGAEWYCEGVYWKIGTLQTSDTRLMPFASVMRPIGSKNHEGPTQHAVRFRL